MNALLFDIGGTNIRIAVTRDGRQVVAPLTVRRPRTYRDGIGVLIGAARQHSARRNITTAVGGIAGTLTATKDRLLNAPHLTSWIGKPLARDLARKLHAPVTLENDSALVALGEAAHGAGRGYAIVAYLGVGTGLGGARIVNGRIDQAALGFEPGHQVIDRRSRARCRCGQYGDLESLVSGTAFRRRFGKPPKHITSPSVWREAAAALAVGLRNIVALWSPDAIVLGGSMMKRPGISIPDVRRSLLKELHGFLPAPPIVHGTLGDIGGLYGALELLKQTKRNAD